MTFGIGVCMVRKEEEQSLLEPKNGKITPIAVSTSLFLFSEGVLAMLAFDAYPSIPRVIAVSCAGAGTLVLYGCILYKQIRFKPISPSSV